MSETKDETALRYRLRAEQLRQIAAGVSEDDAKQLKVTATWYERMANELESFGREAGAVG